MKKFLLILVVILLSVSLRVSSLPPINKQLFLAVERGDSNTVRDLIGKHVSVNASNDEWMTPLHIAAMQGHEEMVSVLLAAGAVLIRNNQGFTAIDVAKTPVIKQLIKNKHALFFENRDVFLMLFVCPHSSGVYDEFVKN
jgi:ankyrin repeat protein